jgi:drug/metabolite transporter (DMT)-like permease
VRWNLAVAALSAGFGFVSIIVGGVDLDAPVLVFFRCLFAVPAIGLALFVTRRVFVLRRGRTVKAALLLGTTLGAHWFLFFETIKASSVAFALLAAYLAPILVALSAPLVLPEQRSRIALAALVPAVAGLALVALAGGEDVGVGPLAILTGLGTALTYAALVIGTKAISARVSAAGLTFWNYTLAGLVMVPLLFGTDRVLPRAGELGYVVLLGVVFTAVSGYLYIWLIRKVTAQTMGVVAYLEVVSGALLAWAVLGEALTWQVAAGGALIIAGGLAVVLFEPEEAELLEKSRIAA